MTDQPDDAELDPQDDPFAPPADATEVSCLHCGEVYPSHLIKWVAETIDGRKTGFWRCPTPDCDGAGFGFDIFPTDPDWKDPTGRLQMVTDDEDEEPFDEEDEEAQDESGDDLDVRNN